MGFKHAKLKGSANGLLLYVNRIHYSGALFSDVVSVCNPMTREYVELPHDDIFYCLDSSSVTYGFGVSKITRQHKVVKFFHSYVCDDETDEILRSTRSFCIVYTLGTGIWRSIATDAPFLYDTLSNGVFLNGNLHWLVGKALVDSKFISCFDLETEALITFSPPPLPPVRGKVLASVVVLRDCLCVCDNTPVDEIVIWLMKDYGDEKSWTKEFVLKKSRDYFTDYDDEFRKIVYPIKVFKDGDILMAWHDYYTFYYSNKTKTTEEFDIFEVEGNDLSVWEVINGMSAMPYTPSFLTLACFPEERLSTF